MPHKTAPRPHAALANVSTSARWNSRIIEKCLRGEVTTGKCYAGCLWMSIGTDERTKEGAGAAWPSPIVCWMKTIRLVIQRSEEPWCFVRLRRTPHALLELSTRLLL